MNLNQSLINKRRPKINRNEPAASTFKVQQVMGPPLTPALKRKSLSTPSSATNWGRSRQNISNSVMRSASSTVSTSETESRSIIALTEGRGDARCEVGIASIDLSLPTLILCQISDGQSYINTLTKINILNPTDIVIPSTFLTNPANRLVDKIRKQFPKVKILSAPRKTFNKSNGMDRILQLCLPSINSICVGLQHKYYALAAASALITFLHNNLCVYYTKESINVTYQESEGYAVIDVSTADRLELVSSTKPTQATRFSSLFGVLNYCETKLGARLLRSTILQPPCNPSIIEQTSQCVAELIKHPQLILSIKTILAKISNIDQLLLINTMTLGPSDSCSARGLNYLLLLNGLIDLIEPLKEVIEHFQEPFFKELTNTLASDKFSLIGNAVRNLIHPSAKFAKNEAGMTERCYAIKSGINGLLDLIRKTYSERLNDMSEYVKHLSKKHKLPLTLANNNTKGYHIVLKLSNQQKRLFKKSDLPREFIQVYRLAGSCTMKTAELINYSTRVEDIMLEILKISNSMINQTICDLKQHIAFFYKLCEDIARLDMLQSLAEASRRGNYIRPKFGEFTELTQARHPILEKLIGDQRIPNPISICKDYNVHIITGPNGSGKSIYIRQVMLLQVMAQIGCYVPAESAIFRPMSRMFARIYLEDNMEYSASAFMLEMKEIKYMMSLLSENSLFVIDELCRSTSADEGTALAMPICEKFCNTSVFLYVTTHYIPLTRLSDLYINVKTWQMETVSSGDTPQDVNLDFKYRLIPGVTTLKHYGVYIVKSIWPKAILDEVYKILENQKSASVIGKYGSIDERLRLKYKLESDLRKLKSRGKLTVSQINKLLNDYENELQKLSNESFSPVLIPQGNDPLETSSYRNLSNFLKESSDNINKLIPEVTIACTENEPIQIGTPVENFTSFDKPHGTFSTSTVWGHNICSNNINNKVTPLSSQTSEENFSEVGEIDQRNLYLTEEPVAGKDLESSEFSQESSYHTATNLETEKPHHIIPVVKVIKGPSWISEDSFIAEGNRNASPSLSQFSESISYSPLQSPVSTSNNLTSNLANQENTSSSSLPFLVKSDKETANTVTTTDTNFENCESVSIEKQSSSKSETNAGKTGSSSLKESDKSNEHQSTKSRKKKTGRNLSLPSFKKFVPPRKLTKREIEEEFKEQDRQIYEASAVDSDYSKYLHRLLNRPTVKQVQNSKHLAFARRTETGVEVIPAAPEPLKKPKQCFKRTISNSSYVDMSIFSDKNAKCFDEFLHSNERDVKRFKFNFDNKSQTSQHDLQFNFQPQTISDYAISGGFKPENVAPSQSFSTYHQPSTPDGYYKRNKEDINKIVEKYLEDSKRDHGLFDSNESNIFETHSINGLDLDL